MQLYHLIFVDHEQLYFGCMKLFIDTPFRILSPLDFYVDMIMGREYDASSFYEFYLETNIDAADFIMALYKADQANLDWEVEDFATFNAFHLDLASIILSSPVYIVKPAKLLKHLSAFLNKVL